MNIKSLLVCGLLALTSSAFAQNFTFTFGDVDIVPGETADLNVTFSSDVTIAGWQMYLYLPTGIEIAQEDDDYFIELSNAHHKKHGVDVTEVSDGSIMLVMSGGTKTYEMSATEGDLCTITLKADNLFRGSATVTVKKIAIADRNGNQYDMEDASFTINTRQHRTIDLVTLSPNEVGFMVDDTFNSGNVSGLFVDNSEIEPKYVTVYGKRYFVIYDDASKVAGLKEKSISYYYKIGQDEYNLEVVLTVNEILKSEAIIEMDENVSLKATFGEELAAPSVTVREGYDGIISYKSSAENVVKVAADGKLTVVGAGNAVITVSGTETTYCNAPSDVTYEVEIEKASIKPVVALQGWTYGQAANVPNLTGNDGNGSVTYQYKVKGAADATYSTTVPTGAGNYTVKAIVEATANYKGGTAIADFTIAPKDVNASMIQAIADLVYTGSALTPQIIVKDGNTSMTLNSDYTVAYSNNTNAGTATVTITGQGNYQGTASRTFAIQKASITPAVTLQGWTYGEAAKTPAVTGNTGKGSVTYQYKGKNAAESTYSTTVPTNAGEYTVKAVVAETNNYKSGTATTNFTISAKALNKNMVDDIEEQIYTGSNIEPKPDVLDGNKKLVEGTDYTIQYSNNNGPGTATLTITGKGNYQGMVTIQFTIKKEGDVNYDNEVGVGDLISVSNYMAEGEYSGVTKKQADVNNDGDVGVGDLISISNIMAGN